MSIHAVIRCDGGHEEVVAVFCERGNAEEFALGICDPESGTPGEQGVTVREVDMLFAARSWRRGGDAG